MMTHLRRILRKLREGPPLRLVLDALARLGLRILPCYLVEEGLSGGGSAPFEGGLEGFRLRRLGPEDMPALASIPGRRVTVEKLLERIEKGNLCLGVEHEGVVVAFTWIDLARLSLAKLDLPLAEDEAYLFDVYTRPEFRGKGLAGYVRHASYKELEGRGKTRLLSITEVYNRASLRVKEKLNARVVALYLVVAIFGRLRFRIRLRKYPVEAPRPAA